MSLTEIQEQTKSIITELLADAKLNKGDIFVVGCSSSEIMGNKLGTASSMETAQAVFEVIYRILKEKGIYLAAQCCEHLGRALIVERELALRERLTIVNAIPQPKAGGSFATAAYNGFEDACAVEGIKAQAGIDIGGVLIGMHLQPTVVPVRLKSDRIGEARILCARTRPKFVGGARAIYDEELL